MKGPARQLPPRRCAWRPACTLAALLLTAVTARAAPPFLSNALAFAEAADALQAREEHVAALELYREAQRDVEGLVQEGLLDVDSAAVLWREWERRMRGVAPQARTEMKQSLLEDYAYQRSAFLNALATNDLPGMQIALTAAADSYTGLQVLSDTNDPMPSVEPTPDAMRTAYLRERDQWRKAWIEQLQPDAELRPLLDTILANRSFDDHLVILDRAAGVAASPVLLSWLENVYATLAVQEPLVFAYHFGLGNSRLLQGDFSGANLAWHDALKYFPASLYVHYHLARTCGHTRAEATRAIAHLRWIVAHSDSRMWNLRAELEMGRRFLLSGDPDSAAVHASEAAMLARADLDAVTIPKYVEAAELHCAALLRLGDTGRAMAVLEEAAETLPGNIELTLEVADTYASLARASNPPNRAMAVAALKWYGRVLARRATRPNVHTRRAYLLLLLGDFAGAEKEAVEELSVNARAPDALAVLGYVSLSKDEYDTARLFFTKALAMDGRNDAALRGLAELDRIGAGR
jgi:tetratricopeptide (TPR) repeat protein